MKQSPADQLYAYWTKLRGDALAPRRFDIEPSRIVSILPHTFILEKLGARDYRFRIAGTAICEAFGFELRTTRFLDGWSPTDAVALERTLAVVTRRGGIGRLTMAANRTAETGSPLEPSRRRERDTVEFEAIFLPLIHTDGAIDRVLGALTPIAPPAWLGRDRLESPAIVSLGTEWPSTNVDPDAKRKGRLEPSAAHKSHPEAANDGLTNLTPIKHVTPALDLHDRQLPFPTHIRKSRIVRADRRQFRVYEGGLGKSDE